MAQHLVLMLVDDEDGDFKNQASLDDFVRKEFIRGVHQTVSFRAYHVSFRAYYKVPDIQKETDDSVDNWILDNVADMQEEFED